MHIYLYLYLRSGQLSCPVLRPNKDWPNMHPETKERSQNPLQGSYKYLKSNWSNMTYFHEISS